jgi:hypothetical protein
MPNELLSIRYTTTVGDHEIRIRVSQTGSRRFVVLKNSANVPGGLGIASGTIHWGTKQPVRYDPGSQAPLNFSEHILRASYDMYR